MLDACVLANYGVANLLLLLAEKPRLYLPLWSEEILAETRRTQTGKFRWEERLADSFQTQLKAEFPESLVSGFDHLIDECTNDIKDRHVLACAIHSKAEVILTFNLKDFQNDALSPWQIAATHPQDYLLMLFELEPLHVMHQLGAISQKRGMTVEDHLIDLGKFLPKFASRLLDDLET
ncbi:MAG: PIN domain-containing protein [Verrucomicrobiales bacterium]|nr:PIN domain-containing protein [Verrucomicrobiales bacterium]